MVKKDTKFKKGQSGNPKGRSKNSGKIANLRALLEPFAPELVAKAKELALDGDTVALRLCLERLVPAIKVKDDHLVIKGLKGDASLTEQGQAIIDSLAKGEVTPSEAASLMNSIASQARILEIEDLEKRVKALEGRQ